MKKKDAGYTLVELLISVTVLALIAVPLTRAFVSAARVNDRSRRQSQAQNVAQNALGGSAGTFVGYHPGYLYDDYGEPGNERERDDRISEGVRRRHSGTVHLHGDGIFKPGL